MRVGTYPTRNFATLGLLGLQFKPFSSPLNLPAPGRRQHLYFIFLFCKHLCFCLTVAWASLLPLSTAPDVHLSPSTDILFPKLRMYFAEFLNEGFLAHLWIFSLPTCVGFSTGTLNLVRSFSWQSFHIIQLHLRSVYLSALGLCLGDLLPKRPTTFDMHFQSHAMLLACVTPSLNDSNWYRNFNRLSFAYIFHFCLGPDFP